MDVLHAADRGRDLHGPVDLPLRVDEAGVAFAGARGISKVEISFDGGRTWADTTLRKILPKDDWMPFTHTWPDPIVGKHDVVVRATDGEGVLQDPAERDSFPDGATGYHHTVVTVA